ncbi:hypothetical protein [Zhongshania arctica]|uniref:Uncharacterized protein n=1 Tax=Zhongshania arctica TaxID=3238302 RepID=A0ABV3TSX0_9GAMM
MEDIAPFIMPFVVVFVDWATNVVGLQMMFYPVRWRGVWSCRCDPNRYCSGIIAVASAERRLGVGE